jgi:hypothetical protein
MPHRLRVNDAETILSSGDDQGNQKHVTISASRAISSRRLN